MPQREPLADRTMSPARHVHRSVKIRGHQTKMETILVVLIPSQTALDLRPERLNRLRPSVVTKCNAEDVHLFSPSLVSTHERL